MGDRSASHWPITLTNGAAALFNLFLPLALVRMLSPEQVGRYKVFFLYATAVPALFLVSGLTNGLYHWMGKYPRTKPEVRQSWTLLLGMSLAFCAAGLALSGRIAGAVKVPAPDLRVFLVCAPFLLASSFLEDLLIARGKIWTGSLYASVFSVARAAAILAAAWVLRDVEGMLWAFLAVSAVRAFAGWRLQSGSGELKPLFSREKSAAALRYAVPVSVAALAGLAFQNVDQLILSFRLPPERFAFYAMGCLSVPPLQVLETSVNRVLIPRLSRAFAGGDLAGAAALFAESVSELHRFLLPAVLGMAVFARPIIGLLFTERYIEAASYLRVYAFSYLLFALPYDVVARARGDGKWILRTSLLFAPLSVAAVWLSAGRWGAMGALGALLTVQTLLRAYALADQERSFKLPPSAFLPLKDIAVHTAAGCAGAALALLARPLFDGPEAWFLITGPLFTLFYFAAVYAVRLGRRRAGPAPIRVLELAQTLGLGGLERMIYSLSRSLHQDGRFSVLAATYDHPEGGPSLAGQFREAGIPLLQWRKGRGFSFLNVFRLIRIVLSKEMHIIHAHDLGPLIYGSLAKVFCPGRVRLFLTLHTLLDFQLGSRTRVYYKFFLLFPDRIIAVSPGVRDGILSLGINPARVQVIPNGVAFPPPPESLSPREKLALRESLVPAAPQGFHGAKWLLCMARIHGGKGQDVVLRAWAAMPQEARARMRLIFVGQETDPAFAAGVRDAAAKAPDPEGIVFAGPSSRPEDWLRAADVFISGSLHEGMPLAPLEAAGAGLPVILSDIEGHRFLASWARLFDPARPEEAARLAADILGSLERDETAFLRNRWRETEPLRARWNAPAMTASYVRTFQA